MTLRALLHLPLCVFANGGGGKTRRSRRGEALNCVRGCLLAPPEAICRGCLQRTNRESRSDRDSRDGIWRVRQDSTGFCLALCGPFLQPPPLCLTRCVASNLFLQVAPAHDLRDHRNMRRMGGFAVRSQWPATMPAEMVLQPGRGRRRTRPPTHPVFDGGGLGPSS